MEKGNRMPMLEREEERRKGEQYLNFTISKNAESVTISNVKMKIKLCPIKTHQKKQKSST